MTMFPRTPAEYHGYIAERLNRFEQLMDKATGFDERQDVTNLILMEILKHISIEEKIEPSIFPPALSRALIDHLVKDKPEFYKFIDIDLSTARTNEPYLESGEFILVDNQFARGEVTLRLNEDRFDAFDLRRQILIKGPFIRFYISNVAGQGLIRLFISRGYHAAIESIEAINRAELAARLGSIVTFDRRGDVVLLDSFEGGLAGWEPTSYGEGGSAVQSSVRARTGAFSCLLTAGSDDYHSAAISRWMPYLSLSSFGFEFSFTHQNPFDYLVLEVFFYDHDFYYKYGIRYIPSEEKLQYVDEVGGFYQDLATGVKLLSSEYLFNTWKMVVDTVGVKYKRLLLNNLSYDLSAIPAYKLASAPPTYQHFDIYLEGREGENDKAYIDDVIVTQNEP